MVHDCPAGIDPLLRLIAPLAAVAPVNVPLHVLLALGVPATCTPAGSVSPKATPASAVPVFGFAIVKVSVEVPPIPMLPGENALLMVGGPATASVAVLLVAPVPPLVELTAPVVLSFPPPEVAVTSTEMAHDPRPRSTRCSG